MEIHLFIYSSGRRKEKKLFSQDKGQKNQVGRFIEAVSNGEGYVIPFEELFSASLVSFKTLESIRKGRAIDV